MNVLSLFDGMSCGRAALELAGFKVDKYFASEIDKYAMAVSAYNYPDIIQIGDVCKVDVKTLPKIDLILAGFPCQPYSVAGKRKGLDDKRGSSIVDAMFHIIRSTQPENILLENVPGLLSIDKGNTFKYLLKELNDCGYAVDWDIINSAKVSAQNRRRAYILCKRLDKCQGSEYSVVVERDNKRYRR